MSFISANSEVTGDLDLTSGSDAKSPCSCDVKALPLSPPFDSFPITEESKQVVCEQCSQLEKLTRIEWHHPIVVEDVEADDFMWMNKQKVRILPLGPVWSLWLLSTCPPCCLVFNISHLTHEELDTHQQTRGGSVQSGTICLSITAAIEAPARWGSRH